jgi:hypothetical protein
MHIRERIAIDVETLGDNHQDAIVFARKKASVEIGTKFAAVECGVQTFCDL